MADSQDTPIALHQETAKDQTGSVKDENTEKDGRSSSSPTSSLDSPGDGGPTVMAPPTNFSTQPSLTQKKKKTKKKNALEYVFSQEVPTVEATRNVKVMFFSISSLFVPIMESSVAKGLEKDERDAIILAHTNMRRNGTNACVQARVDESKRRVIDTLQKMKSMSESATFHAKDNESGTEAEDLPAHKIPKSAAIAIMPFTNFNIPGSIEVNFAIPAQSQAEFVLSKLRNFLVTLQHVVEIGDTAVAPMTVPILSALFNDSTSCVYIASSDEALRLGLASTAMSLSVNNDPRFRNILPMNQGRQVTNPRISVSLEDAHHELAKSITPLEPAAAADHMRKHPPKKKTTMTGSAPPDDHSSYKFRPRFTFVKASTEDMLEPDTLLFEKKPSTEEGELGCDGFLQQPILKPITMGGVDHLIFHVCNPDRASTLMMATADATDTPLQQSPPPPPPNVLTSSLLCRQVLRKSMATIERWSPVITIWCVGPDNTSKQDALDADACFKSLIMENSTNPTMASYMTKILPIDQCIDVLVTSDDEDPKKRRSLNLHNSKIGWDLCCEGYVVMCIPPERMDYLLQ